MVSMVFLVICMAFSRRSSLHFQSFSPVPARACGVEVIAEHEAAGLLEPQLLLKLQGAHRGDRLEVVVEARDAHPELARDVLDPKWVVELFAQPLDGLDDAVGGAA